MIKTNITREIEVAAGQNIKERDYWLAKFSDGGVKSSFPYDPQSTAPRQRETGERKTFEFKWDDQLFSRLMELSKRKDHTLHVILLTGLTALMHRYTGNGDITIGTTIYRQAFDGVFINTLLPLRSRLNPGTTFRELLVRVKETVLQAAAHQSYPIELLAERLNLPVSNHCFPFFDVALLLENIQDEQYLRHINPDMTFLFLRNPGNINAAVRYNPAFYQSSTVENITTHFAHLLAEGLSNPDLKISDLEILSREEKRKLLLDFNDTGTGYPVDKTLQGLFAEQVERTPDQVALIGEIPNSKFQIPNQIVITYKELNKKSAQLAFLLQAKGVQADTIVGIMMERSWEMIMGILGILKAGGAYLPIDPGYPPERIDFMLKDSHTNILVTTSKLAEEGEKVRRLEGKKNLQIVLLDFSTLLSFHPHLPLRFNAPATSLAYIIYTSGTTGKPRGVMVEHRRAVNLCFWHNRYFKVTERDHASHYAGICFDASVWEIFPYLIKGASLYIVHEEIRLDFQKLNGYFETHDITIGFLPTQLSEHFTRLRNRSLRILLTGGDKLRVFNRTAYQLYNNYGPTENTVVASSFLVEKDYENIPIGKPIDNVFIYILDRSLNLQPVGVPGELCIKGMGVARGYLNRPELTAEKFCLRRPGGSFRENRPLDPHKSFLLNQSPIYKSGDLARWSPTGHMEYLGRLDHQVKIRGFRIELGEIETQLLRHRAVKDAVVLAREDNKGDKYLCAYIAGVGTGENIPGTDEFAAYLSNLLPDYMIPTYFVPIKKLPLTPNGKIDRNALPEPGIDTGEAYTAPRDRVEKKLAELFARLLGIPKEKIGIDTHFFRAGGHSLKAAQLIAVVHKAFNVILSMGELFKAPRLGELAEGIKKSGQVAYTAVEPAEKREYYPLSPIQKRLFIVNQMEGIGTAYNLTEVFLVLGPLERQRLEQASRLLIRRHETLRTSFVMVRDEVVQRVQEENDQFPITNPKPIANSKSSMTNIINDFIRPFDLAAAPLLRLGLVETGDEKHLLMVDIHHIVSDGTSQGILFRDLFRLYDGRILPELPIQYKDFSLWQTSARGKAEIARQEPYWLRLFEKKLPGSDIFTDFPRPPLQSFKGEHLSFTLQEKLVEKINRLTKETGTTLYMVLLAVYTLLLAKYTGREDIIVGTPVAGREHADLENLMGIFINALPMRNYPKKELTFAQFLDHVKENTLNAFENQSYPFDFLLEKLDIKVDMSRNPVFDVELVLLNMDRQELTARELTFIAYDYEINATQVDLALYGSESGEKIKFDLFYAASLFKGFTMERFCDYFKEVLRTVVDNRDLKLAELHISDALAGTESGVYENLEVDLEF